MTLTAEEFKKISFGPKTIEFGAVAVLSENKKCFSVQNNLPQCVLVEIKVRSLPWMCVGVRECAVVRCAFSCTCACVRIYLYALITRVVLAL